jgi:DNA-binding response OmpR family regulator
MFRAASAPPLILLVDDDPYQAEIGSYIAYELGCAFDSALSGTEALEKIAQSKPDIVLLDVKMPDISGYEICRRIKTAPESAGTQVLFVTAKTEEEDLLQGFEALANDYLTKPFSARELKARAKNALRTKALVDALTARTSMLELQQEITDRIEDPAATDEESRAQRLGTILDRTAALFAMNGATLHLRRSGQIETRVHVSGGWPDGTPPAYIAALGLVEDPRVERAPRMPGEAAAAEWTVFSAPLWVGSELTGTLRVHRRGPLPPAGDTPEVEHLVALASYLARTLYRANLISERS